jgi:hypothetical protein
MPLQSRTAAKTKMNSFLWRDNETGAVEFHSWRAETFAGEQRNGLRDIDSDC